MDQECKKYDLEHLGCLMDALVWLESIKHSGLAKTPSKAKKLSYTLDPSFSVNHFLFHIEEDKIFLAFGNNGEQAPVISWFVNMPWREVRVMDGQNPCLLLISKEINCPALPGSSFFDADSKISEFGIRIPIYPDFVDILEFDSIWMATCEISENRISLIERASKPVPLVSAIV